LELLRAAEIAWWAKCGTRAVDCRPLICGIPRDLEQFLLASVGMLLLFLARTNRNPQQKILSGGKEIFPRGFKLFRIHACSYGEGVHVKHVCFIMLCACQCDGQGQVELTICYDLVNLL